MTSRPNSTPSQPLPDEAVRACEAMPLRRFCCSFDFLCRDIKNATICVCFAQELAALATAVVQSVVSHDIFYRHVRVSSIIFMQNAHIGAGINGEVALLGWMSQSFSQMLVVAQNLQLLEPDCCFVVAFLNRCRGAPLRLYVECSHGITVHFFSMCQMIQNPVRETAAIFFNKIQRFLVILFSYVTKFRVRLPKSRALRVAVAFLDVGISNP